MTNDLLNRISRDPAVMGGRPCIRGMRVTVGTILGLLATGASIDEVLTDYPYLEKEDIQAALTYAASRCEEVEVPLDKWPDGYARSFEEVSYDLERAPQGTPDRRRKLG